MNLTIEEARIGIKAVNEVLKGGYVSDIEEVLLNFIKDKQEENRQAIIKENTISMKEAPAYADFRDIVWDILHERLLDQTPHGEHGGDIDDIFYWNDKEWDCLYTPDWNRHDKTYYFIDNWGNDNLRIEEVETED